MLNDSAFEAGVENLLDSLYSTGQTTAQARTQFASTLKDLVKDYVKSMTITIPTGAVIVTGTASTQNNPSAIILNNIIS